MEYTTLPIIRTKQLSDDFFEVIFKRKREKLYLPGDYIYVKKSPSDDFKPYFIASGKNDPWARIIMRGSAADFTTLVEQYGNKLRTRPSAINVFPGLESGKRPVFIGSSVGISPFFAYISSYPSDILTLYAIDNIPNKEWVENYPQAFVLPSIEKFQAIFNPQTSADYYICAPREMVQQIKDILLKANIKESRINYAEYD